jgi:hypothetical protein
LPQQTDDAPRNVAVAVIDGIAAGDAITKGGQRLLKPRVLGLIVADQE